MIQVRRQDVGTDVVYLPERKLVILHPDLDYAEALGAIKAVLPDLHVDVAVRLVEKVTPRPKRKRKITRGRVAAVLTSAILSAAGGLGWMQPAAAAMFGPTWAGEMTRMGLTCQPTSRVTRTCTSADGTTAEVTGYRRDGAALYVLRRPGTDESFILIFDTHEQAQAWAERHPDDPVTGRVAAL